MKDTKTSETEFDSETLPNVYLPAVSAQPQLRRFERFVTDLFDFHGVVLIPDSYNK
jgi:hypothetical protein